LSYKCPLKPISEKIGGRARMAKFENSFERNFLPKDFSNKM